MSKVAVIGTDRKGRSAVLAVGDYSGTWSIRWGQFENDSEIVCTTTGRGLPEKVLIVDGGSIPFAAKLTMDPIGRHDASLRFSRGGLTFTVMPQDALEWVPAAAAIEAIS